MDAKAVYKVNDDFKEYVRRYCQKDGCTVEEALTHSTVRNAAEYYFDIETGKKSVSENRSTQDAGVGECK